MTNHRTHAERSDTPPLASGPMTGHRRDRHGPAVADTIGHFARACRSVVVAMMAALPALVVGAPTPKEPPHEAVVPAQCAVPDDTAMVDGPLPRLARKMKTADPLTIVVIGSGSAAGSGTSRKEAAFPYRLDARFQKAFNQPKTRLVVLAEMGQTAPVMYARLAKDVIPLKPALVIWQTGSADAARGTPVMEFGTALEHGIAELRAQGSDVLLIDSQFSPRASLLVNTDSYREAVRWNARRYDLPLFKRYDTMQYWWSHDVFDLDAEGKASQLDNADHIHDCVAALLVRLIQRGIAGGGNS